METKIGFKVVVDMHSTVVSIKSGGVKYKLNERVEPHPNCGPMVLFTNIGAAEDYARDFFRTPDVYLCEYQESSHKSVWCIDHRQKDLKEIIELTTAKYSNPRPHEIAFADWVILKEKIEPEVNHE